MLRHPDRAELASLADQLGFDFTTAEMDVAADRIDRQVSYLSPLETTPAPAYGHAPIGPRNWHWSHEAVDPYHAFITFCDLPPLGEGPLSGQRAAVKDNIAVSGVPLTFGSAALAGYAADVDATVVTRLREAGARITGKLNMYEFSSGDSPGAYGRALNPLDTARETGGSSSGAGSAVASGACDIALGGDQGGSIRVPAAWCGIVGLKPTFGLVPHTGIYGADPTLDHVGPMARTVEGVAAALAAIAGPDGLDPRQAGLSWDPGTRDGYLAGLHRGVRGMRIGVLAEGRSGADDAVAERLDEAVAALTGLGARIGTVSVPEHADGYLRWLPIWLEGLRYLADTNLGGAFAKTSYPTSLIAAMAGAKAGSAHLLPLNLRVFLLSAEYLHRRYGGVLYAKAQNLRPATVAAYDEVFRSYDVMLMPTVGSPPPLLPTPTTIAEQLDARVFGGRGMDLGAVAGNTAVFNYTGHPALTLPAGRVPGGPVGLQLVGPFQSEAMLLRVGAAVESAFTPTSEPIVLTPDTFQTATAR